MQDIVVRCVERLHELFDSTSLDVEWKKLEQKFNEARYNPGDVKPLADCILSILLAARHQGFDAATVLAELERLCSELMKRQWKKMPDGTYQSF